MTVEDGATLAECLSRAETADQIPKAMRVYEAVRKPRAEKLKNISEASGIEKHYPDGENQRKRDEQRITMNSHLKNIPTKGQLDKHPSHWIMSYNVVGHVSALFLLYDFVLTDGRQILSSTRRSGVGEIKLML
jgi:salicylate hydroxylase